MLSTFQAKDDFSKLFPSMFPGFAGFVGQATPKQAKSKSYSDSLCYIGLLNCHGFLTVSVLGPQISRFPESTSSFIDSGRSGRQEDLREGECRRGGCHVWEALCHACAPPTLWTRAYNCSKGKQTGHTKRNHARDKWWGDLGTQDTSTMTTTKESGKDKRRLGSRPWEHKQTKLQRRQNMATLEKWSEDKQPGSTINSRNIYMEQTKPRKPEKAKKIETEDWVVTLKPLRRFVFEASCSDRKMIKHVAKEAPLQRTPLRNWRRLRLMGSRGELHESLRRTSIRLCEILEIIGFRAPGKPNLPWALGRHSPDHCPHLLCLTSCLKTPLQPSWVLWGTASILLGSLVVPVLDFCLQAHLWSTHGAPGKPKKSPMSHASSWHSFFPWSLRVSTSSAPGRYPQPLV